MDDFLIIGGGIAGLSAAAALAPLGRVTLLEGETHLGHHSSSRSAAVFLEHYGNATVRALNRASAPYYRATDVLTPRTMLLVARPGEDEAFAQALREFDATEIPVAEAQSLWPILDRAQVHRTARYNGAEDIDTDRVMQGFAKAARGSGATLRTGANVTQIDGIEGGWKVLAGGET
ncbi:MAG: FAD-dependent oxidoreductase, partial [Pseudomonadota bacterium]